MMALAKMSGAEVCVKQHCIAVSENKFTTWSLSIYKVVIILLCNIFSSSW